MANLILASSSARRKELLEQVGLKFEIFSPDIDESIHENENIEQYVKRLAEEKAQAVLLKFPDAIIIAADTSLLLDQKIIGKPLSKQHAFEIWSALSGRQHEVLSAVCVLGCKHMQSTVVRTQVDFQLLNSQMMEDYWATKEPVGKAGGYAIQGYAARYIVKIQGSYSNVVGLPLYETLQLLDSIIALESDSEQI